MMEMASQVERATRVQTVERAERVLVNVAPRVPAPVTVREPGLVARVLSGLLAYLPAWQRESADDRFQWNVTARQLGDVRSGTVYCVELPVSDPVGMLASYLQAGVRADHVVFVGDPATIKDADYYAITRKGALVHETSKKERRAQAERDLTAYFGSPSTVVARPTSNPNEYTYNPGPAKVTPEQLQAHLDAIGRRRR